MSSPTSRDVRAQLVHALELDLVGPHPDTLEASEVLREPPSRWYLTGFLVPYGGSLEERSDEESDDELDEATTEKGTDDANAPDGASKRKAFFPSSLGISVLVPKGTRQLTVEALWGDYLPLDAEGSESGRWQRQQRRVELQVELPLEAGGRAVTSLPGFAELQLMTTIRPLKDGKFGDGVRAVALFIVNQRKKSPAQQRDEAYLFQVGLRVRCAEGFSPRENLRGLGAEDRDDQIADLQYRDVAEYAVGHGVSTHATMEADSCHLVETAWMPRAEVERVVPFEATGVDLRMDSLASCETAAQVREKLGALTTNYASWLKQQRTTVPADPQRREVAEDLLNAAEHARQRIEQGLATLDKPEVLQAFQLANRAMARAQRQRARHRRPDAEVEPKWRTFQIAFVLMNLRGLSEPGHHDREVVDLLFFPTGGGKTEAYLGLAAVTLFLRRLRNAGLSSAGLSVLMRYTLRLLTLDQLGRAATLICAMELERQASPKVLGPWPFEIGLWVGQAATPNRMGKKGDSDPYTARARTLEYQANSDRHPSPIPLETCPWCGSKFGPASFHLYPNADTPTDLRIQCLNRSCEFRAGNPLPILAVDGPIYRRLPCFLIATLDKFAALPWEGRVGTLFGKVARQDEEGFYGPCDPNAGERLEKDLLPPDLIIQDELHLISGPLGTMAGLYEAAIDALATRQVDGKTIRPKIVASTATVRRADAQIRALFARPEVEVFPPPGPDRRDSFFARVEPLERSPGRLYLGISAPGRSLKVVLMRSSLVLLAAAQKAYQSDKASTDPYMTLVGYFSSLRELGGSRRIVEDEVRTRCGSYGRRVREGQQPGDGLFVNRTIAYDVLELTSRVSTSKVAEAKERLERPFTDKAHVDVALATNMISVGLDIGRLGLMVVLGQPKGAAEYIQATSRVGRETDKPGLVVVIQNAHRPRDRSHYERFETFHASFYREVEATSVTPFSSRAVDRGLAGVVVGLARQSLPELTPPLGAEQLAAHRSEAHSVEEVMARRAEQHAQLDATAARALGERVKRRVANLLDDWAKIATENIEQHAALQYQQEVGEAPRLLYDPLSPELADLDPRRRQFRANRSLRDVEPTVGLFVKTLDGGSVEAEEEG